MTTLSLTDTADTDVVQSWFRAFATAPHVVTVSSNSGLYEGIQYITKHSAHIPDDTLHGVFTKLIGTYSQLPAKPDPIFENGVVQVFQQYPAEVQRWAQQRLNRHTHVESMLSDIVMLHRFGITVQEPPPILTERQLHKAQVVIIDTALQGNAVFSYQSIPAWQPYIRLLLEAALQTGCRKSGGEAALEAFKIQDSARQVYQYAFPSTLLALRAFWAEPTFLAGVRKVCRVFTHKQVIDIADFLYAGIASGDIVGKASHKGSLIGLLFDRCIRQVEKMTRVTEHDHEAILLGKAVARALHRFDKERKGTMTDPVLVQSRRRFIQAFTDNEFTVNAMMMLLADSNVVAVVKPAFYDIWNTHLHSRGVLTIDTATAFASETKSLHVFTVFDGARMSQGVERYLANSASTEQAWRSILQVCGIYGEPTLPDAMIQVLGTQTFFQCQLLSTLVGTDRVLVDTIKPREPWQTWSPPTQIPFIEFLKRVYPHLMSFWQEVQCAYYQNDTTFEELLFDKLLPQFTGRDMTLREVTTMAESLACTVTDVIQAQFNASATEQMHATLPADLIDGANY